MRIRKNVEAMAVPVLLIAAAGAGLAILVPATAAAHTSRPGKVVTGETGAGGEHSLALLADGTEIPCSAACGRSPLRLRQAE